MSNYFLRKESSRYSLVAGGDSTDKCFVTFRSKENGAIIVNFHAQDLLKGPEQAARFGDYLRTAEALEGIELDRHLEDFIPLADLDSERFSHILGSAATEKNLRGVSLARLMNLPPDVSKAKYMDTMNDFYNTLGDFLHPTGDTLDDYLRELEVKEIREEIQLLVDRISDDEMSFRYLTLSQALKVRRLSLESSFLQEIDTQSDSGRALANVLTLLHSDMTSIHSSEILRRLMISVSSSHLMPLGTELKEYHEAVKKVVMEGSDLLSSKELDSYGVFGGEEGSRYKNTLYASPGIDNGSRHAKPGDYYRIDGIKGTASSVISAISSIKDPVEKRNALQVMHSIGYGQGVASRTTDFIGHAVSRSLLGESMSKILWDFAKGSTVNGEYIEGSRTKFGKKETQILLSNIGEFNKIIYHATVGEIRTFEGETLKITPCSRDEMYHYFTNSRNRNSGIDPSSFKDGEETTNGYNAYSAKYARVEMISKNKKEVFDGYLEISEISAADTFAGLFAISDMPVDLIKRKEHFKAVLKCLGNSVLVNDLCRGGIKLRNGEIRDREAYSGPWQTIVSRVDGMISKDPSVLHGDTAFRIKLEETRTLGDYIDTMKIRDTKDMLVQACLALNASYLPNPCPQDYGEDEYDISLSLDTPQRIQVMGVYHILSIYPVIDHVDKLSYNNALRLAEKAHSGYGKMKSVTSPNTELSWEKCLPDITLMDKNGRTIQIININSHSDVVQEGSDMDHCLSTYAGKCIKGEYMVFSVLVDGDKYATLGMDIEFNNISFDQLQGPGNTAVEPEVARLIEDEFIATLVTENQVKGYNVILPNIDNSSLSMSGEEALSVALDYEIADEKKVRLLKGYLTSLLGEDAVFNIVNQELSDLEDSVRSVCGDSKEWCEKKVKIDSLRSKLLSDFDRDHDIESTLSS